MKLPKILTLTILLLFFFLLSSPSPSPSYPCKPPHFSHYPFCNTSLPLPSRATSLLSHLTLPEKIIHLSYNNTALPRLGLPPYIWWSESLHGLAINGPGVSFSNSSSIPSATSFPQVILSAASVNRSLFRSIAAAIAVEAMVSVLQALYRYTISEKWENFTRYTFDAKVTAQDMEDTYQLPFRACIEDGKASCLMCSYNQVNGVPACARGDLLRKARDEWGFEGYITADCDAVADIYINQGYAMSPEDAVADVLKAGLDIDCGPYLLLYTESILKLGKISEEDINRALLNLFMVQLRLGLYDGNPLDQRFGRLGPRDVCTREHRDIALEAARQGFVLLKNDQSFLPWRKNKVASLAIIGPAAKDSNLLGGDYTGIPCDQKSLFEGLQSYVHDTRYAAGCIDVTCLSNDGFGEAIRVASEAELVVVVAGLNLTEETEGLDRVSLLLPGKQMDLVNAVARASKKPIVLVLTGGGPLDVSFAKANPLIASIIWIGYPAEVGGQVLAETLFGKFNPGGKLPVTWYPESFTKVPMNDMNMRADPSRGYPGRTYRFYTGEVVYEFGYGLSYSNYSYIFLSAPEKISLSSSSFEAHIDSQPRQERNDGLDRVHIGNVSSCNALRFEAKFSVTNDGEFDGSPVVLLFWKPRVSVKGSPIKQLVGFERVHTTAKRSSEVGILIEPCKHLSSVNEQGERILLLGDHVLMLGDLELVLTIEI